MKFQELREKYDKFIYEKYEINTDWEFFNITYFFEIPNLSKFTPTIKIDKKNIKNQNIDEDFLNNLVFHIWLVELISYWKCACPKNVEIKAGYIDEEQIKRFKKMYFYGLGEFFYTNGIEVDEENFMEIKCSKSPLNLLFGKEETFSDCNPLDNVTKYKFIFIKWKVWKFDFQSNANYIKDEHFITSWTLPYHKDAKEKAKILRNNQTESEKTLRKDFLKGLDINIYRQKPIDHFVADFYIPSCKLIIELDWWIHDNQIEYDERRDKRLSMYWIAVARIKNSALENHFQEVTEELINIINQTKYEKQKLDTESFINFSYNSSDSSPSFSKKGPGDDYHWNLITIWWWKDSNVTLELLKWMDNDTFILNPKSVTLECSKIAGYENPFIAHRTIDPRLIELNKQWFLNGHTPFNALLAFLTYLIAYLWNKKYIVLSNESSANESNVRWLKVNHQYSKSFEFENDFNEYTKKYFWIWIKYFSLLRPLLEIQIAQLFSRFEQYHKVFKSCNVWSKTEPRRRCCNCPKCLFVFIMLSPFLSTEKLVEIFGENLFEKESLLQTFIDLTWNSDNKPFECVWTYDEVNYAIYLTVKKYNWKLPYLLKYYVDNFELKDNNLLEYFNEENNLDPEFLEILKKSL